MPKFTKIPVEIEARQFTDENTDELVEWINSGKQIDILDRNAVGLVNVTHEDKETISDIININTLEGTMIAKPGDWIICGVKGEFYPCKPDIFEMTYDPVDPPPKG